MRARCVAIELTNEQRRITNAPSLFQPRYDVKKNKEYLVLGISVVFDSTAFGNTALLEIEDDEGKCVSVPISLFEIIDERVSVCWLARTSGNRNITLWPLEFYEPFFHDRLSDDDPSTRETFRAMLDRLKREFE